MEQRPPKMKYCTRCILPKSSAAPLAFDDDGVCSGCRVHDQKDEQVDWDLRAKELKDITDKYKSRDGNNYDCLIPVSGGKDSYFQVWYMTKVLGLKPLLLTYYGNDFTEAGKRNLYRMKEVFNVDHLIMYPSVEILKKLHKKCFKLMGDMSWHNHCGIFSFPVQIAVRFNIPLLIWGEHGYTDSAGMYGMDDKVEMTKKFRTEHACRGFDWFDMIDEKEGISQKDLLWTKYPTDEDLEKHTIRGLYLGFYVYWDANKHGKMMEEWGFETLKEPYSRTYRRMSALDDQHEPGIHDYLKYIKFGYGRGTDHPCKDTRLKYLTRPQAIQCVKKYDDIKPKDLKRWLAYTGTTEEEFDAVCDRFRDPSVWWIDKNGHWKKDNIWDNEPPYDGPDELDLTFSPGAIDVDISDATIEEERKTISRAPKIPAPGTDLSKFYREDLQKEVSSKIQEEQ
jgi:N-acetyl sugar amidotransferase